MSSIVLVDTSVLLNVLNVPTRNQDYEAVLSQMSDLIDAGVLLFIPMAAIIETGNHIAHIPNGRLRRQAAERFVDVIGDALKDKAPWKPISFPNASHLLGWLGEFPDSAMRKVGMGDLSIKKEWEQLCRQWPMSRVHVWTVDADLHGLDRCP